MTLRFEKVFFPGSDGLYKWTFWVYMDGFNLEKIPNCDVYGTYSSANKEARQR